MEKSINLLFISINNVQNLKVYVYFHRTMVRTVDFGMYLGIGKEIA